MKSFVLSLIILCVASGLAIGQDAGVLVTRAKASIEKKEYDSALADLTQAIVLQKKNAEAFALRGDVYMAQKKIELARVDYEQAIKLAPKISAYYVKRGMSFKESPGYSREAQMADFNKALALDPQNEDALRERGFIYFVDEKIPLAVADFEAALKLDSMDGPIYAYLARIHKRTSMDQAIADYNTYLSIVTDDPYGFVERGQLLESQGKADLALADYNRVIELLPNDVIGYSNRADVYLRAKKYVLGIADLNKVIGMRPNDSSGYSRRGLVYEVEGKYDLAIEDYKKALSLDSYNSGAKVGYPRAYEKFKAVLPTAEATEAVYKGLSNTYRDKVAVFNTRSEEFFKIDDAQQKLAKPDLKMVCGKVTELRSLFGEVMAAYGAMQQMYDSGKLAGFTPAIIRIEEIAVILADTDKAVIDYEKFYKCK